MTEWQPIEMGRMLIESEECVVVTIIDGQRMFWSEWIKTPEGQKWSSENAVTREDIEFAANYVFRQAKNG